MINDFRTEKLTVPIDKVMPNRWNPNYQEKVVFEKQKKSVEELGFLGSILVRKINHTTCDYEILDGEHRWKAAKEHGYTEIQIECIKGEVLDKEAQLLTILLNNLRGKDDVFKRAKILEALDQNQLSLLPFTEEEIEHEKRFVQFDFSQYEKEGEEMPEREFALVIVLPFNVDEAMVWNKAKEELVNRGMISEKNKKKQDIQMVMRLLKNFLNIVENSNMNGKVLNLEK